jgi:hypothetical protein
MHTIESTIVELGGIFSQVEMNQTFGFSSRENILLLPSFGLYYFVTDGCALPVLADLVHFGPYPTY